MKIEDITTVFQSNLDLTKATLEQLEMVLVVKWICSCLYIL